MTALPPGMSALQVLKEKHDEIFKMNLNLEISGKSIESIANTVGSFLNAQAAPVAAPMVAPVAASTPTQATQATLPKKTYKRQPKNTLSTS